MHKNLTTYKPHLVVVILLLFNLFVVEAQTTYFRVVSGIPHLPVYNQTSDVSAPRPGALIYSRLDASVMIYQGRFWDTFCTRQLPTGTNGYTNFTVASGLPYLPIVSTTAVTSTAGTSGTVYYPSNITEVLINNTLNWYSPRNLSTLPVATSMLTAGNLTGQAGGVAIPVMAANPAFNATDIGAIYLNSGDKMLHMNNGTAWVALDCNACPPVATAVQVEWDWNTTNFRGGYAYYQKDNYSHYETGTVTTWYLADNGVGANATIDLTNSQYWYYRDAAQGKWLKFSVMPKSTVTPLGTEAATGWYYLWNCPPQADAVNIGGTLAVSNYLEGGFTYFDKEGNAEDLGHTIYQWYWDNLSTPITGATGAGYTLTAADRFHRIGFSVIPKASSGYSTGDMKSVFTTNTVP